MIVESYVVIRRKKPSALRKAKSFVMLVDGFPTSNKKGERMQSQQDRYGRQKKAKNKTDDSIAGKGRWKTRDVCDIKLFI